VTKESSGENYIKISKIIPMISCLLKQFTQIKPHFEVIYEIKDLLHAELTRRFGIIEQVKLITISTLLNQRFKNLHFNDPVACSSSMADLRKLTKLDTISSSESKEENSKTDNFDFWAHLKYLVHGQKKKNTTNFMNDELSLYLSNPVSTLKSDPLVIWEDIKHIFPIYTNKQVCISLWWRHLFFVNDFFSKSGAALTKSRIRLTSSRLQKILLLVDIPEEDLFQLYFIY